MRLTQENFAQSGWRVPTDNEWMQIEGTADTKYSTDDSIWY